MPILATARQHSLQGVQLRGSVPEAQMIVVYGVLGFWAYFSYCLAFGIPGENKVQTSWFWGLLGYVSLAISVLVLGHVLWVDLNGGYRQYEGGY
jgi:hypothetical protein